MRRDRVGFCGSGGTITIVSPVEPAPQPQQLVPMVERQHALIEALLVRSPRVVPAQVLARDLGVQRRTIERDIARLRVAGLPVDVRRGPGGGYALRAGRHPRTIVLTAGETAALVVSLGAVGPASSASALGAMSKLVAALRGE